MLKFQKMIRGIIGKMSEPDKKLEEFEKMAWALKPWFEEILGQKIVVSDQVNVDKDLK